MDYKMIEAMLSKNLTDPTKGIDNIKEQIEVPKTFEKVILKMLPEISSIDIFDCLGLLMYNPADFEPVMSFKVIFVITIKQTERPNGDFNYYKEQLTSLFKMTYGDEMSSFIKFGVEQIIETRKKSNEELFFELFGKKPKEPNEPLLY